jgi:hypothetical protein
VLLAVFMSTVKISAWMPPGREETNRDVFLSVLPPFCPVHATGHPATAPRTQSQKNCRMFVAPSFQSGQFSDPTTGLELETWPCPMTKLSYVRFIERFFYRPKPCKLHQDAIVLFEALTWPAAAELASRLID